MYVVYFLVLFALSIYSYSQIDLNLTLFNWSPFLTFQSVMIQLGYYLRPLSTLFFILLVSTLFIFYFHFLSKAQKNNISVKQIIYLLAGIALCGLISYPAFSHDIFNYMFDIRILTHYGQNPYQFRPQDFPADSWLRFMHWVHRPYPYGPIWLILTFLPSLFGLGKFVVTLFNFKILFLSSYLGSVYLIRKILTRVDPAKANLGVVFFALNPLVIIESILSPHLDSVMVFFFLFSLYLILSQKKVAAIISLLLSAGVKFITVLVLPLILVKLPFKNIVKFSCLFLLISLIPVIYQREFYPWYFLPAISSFALIPPRGLLLTISVAFSAGLVLTYAPFIYTGYYPPEVQLAKLAIVSLFPLFALVVIYGRKYLYLKN